MTVREGKEATFSPSSVSFPSFFLAERADSSLGGDYEKCSKTVWEMRGREQTKRASLSAELKPLDETLPKAGLERRALLPCSLEVGNILSEEANHSKS